MAAPLGDISDRVAHVCWVMATSQGGRSVWPPLLSASFLLAVGLLDLDLAHCKLGFYSKFPGVSGSLAHFNLNVRTNFAKDEYNIL